jgi:hypothetical protein
MFKRVNFSAMAAVIIWVAILLGVVRVCFGQVIPDLGRPVWECSDAFLNLTYQDDAGNAVNPARSYLWIYDRDQKVQVWPNSGIFEADSPGTSLRVNVGPGGTRVLNRRKSTEQHLVTTAFEYGNDCSLPSRPDCHYVTNNFTLTVKRLENAICGPGPTFGPSPLPTTSPSVTSTPTMTGTVTQTPTHTPGP